MELLSRPRPCSLQELSLTAGTKISPSLAAELFSTLTTSGSQLSKLKLRDQPILVNNPTALANAAEYLGLLNGVPDRQLCKTLDKVR